MTDSRLDIPGPRLAEGDEPPALEVVARELATGLALVEVRGELDTMTAGGFDRWMREQLDGRADVVVDLDRVAFLASAGIGVLVGLRREAGRRGVRLHLTGRRNNVVCRPIEVLKLGDVLDLQADRDAVVAELAPAG